MRFPEHLFTVPRARRALPRARRAGAARRVLLPPRRRVGGRLVGAVRRGGARLRLGAAGARADAGRVRLHPDGERDGVARRRHRHGERGRRRLRTLPDQLRRAVPLHHRPLRRRVRARGHRGAARQNHERPRRAAEGQGRHPPRRRSRARCSRRGRGRRLLRRLFARGPRGAGARRAAAQRARGGRAPRRHGDHGLHFGHDRSAEGRVPEPPLRHQQRRIFARDRPHPRHRHVVLVPPLLPRRRAHLRPLQPPLRGRLRLLRGRPLEALAVHARSRADGLRQPPALLREDSRALRRRPRTGARGRAPPLLRSARQGARDRPPSSVAAASADRIASRLRARRAARARAREGLLRRSRQACDLGRGAAARRGRGVLRRRGPAHPASLRADGERLRRLQPPRQLPVRHRRPADARLRSAHRRRTAKSSSEAR